ncbi:YopX family protein [Mammaliicoccus sciuri]|uniref:YopX family protein n=1 Tax=Mammaliicoccus sciuri TaxID=1296 RepID=UPI0021D354AA|nr:YopX family protein [Mammaliicoccus sciuri]UXU83310.1 YopX family protein [Mammaliicoccus sciuri]UXU93157.1 YopX family protein [Mammaliicoccus sciuri]UXV15107.1 YopX family protein [Mammaliicoccus sciuri]UXV23370.1 YopX family protein [Mammaliicoccus sciuri]UXV26148.1 YopX family protein [Mammaliicoccus sciuri]
MIPKFRVWDKVNGTMHKVAGINFGINGARVISLAETNRYNNNHKRWHTDVELLQSTGLLDKNGKEIFEGDIIDKGYSNIDIVDRIGYVKFGTGDDSDGYLNQEWLGWTTNNDDSLLDVHEHCTVLGNKFEHPHLLGED